MVETPKSTIVDFVSIEYPNHEKSKISLIKFECDKKVSKLTGRIRELIIENHNLKRRLNITDHDK